MCVRACLNVRRFVCLQSKWSDDDDDNGAQRPAISVHYSGMKFPFY